VRSGGGENLNGLWFIFDEQHCTTW
jgi:hypothetical protein